jgi:hypothetical protein
MHEYSSNINMKRQLASIEHEIEVKQAHNSEVEARQSLYRETSKRKEILNKFKDEFKNDYLQK